MFCLTLNLNPEGICSDHIWKQKVSFWVCLHFCTASVQLRVNYPNIAVQSLELYIKLIDLKKRQLKVLLKLFLSESNKPLQSLFKDSSFASGIRILSNSNRIPSESHWSLKCSDFGTHSLSAFSSQALLMHWFGP